MMKHPRSNLALAIIAVGVVAGVILQDSLFFAHLLALLGLLIAVPFTAVIGFAGLTLLISKALPEEFQPDPRLAKIMSYMLVIGFSSVISLLAMMDTGGLINYCEVRAVQRYVTKAAPILDQVKAKEGAYPSALPVALIGKPPFLFRQ
jgi:hypothetical protein